MKFMVVLDAPGFEAITLLSENAQGAVYRAKRVHDALPVVLKRAYGEAARNKLEHEFTVLMQLKSPHIVRAYSFEEVAQSPLLVLQDVTGSPFADLNEPAAATLLEMARGAALALHTAHDAGFIHRDITLANLIWNDSEQHTTLLDFGIAIQTHCFAVAEGDRLPGTLAYMAPEQLGGQVDCRTDLYSLGVCLYTLRAGHLPFSSEHPMALIDAHKNHLPAALPERADVPATFDDIILRLLSKHPDDRYSSSHDLLTDLAQLAPEV
jgi:serine/threonine protein kinase